MRKLLTVAAICLGLSIFSVEAKEVQIVHAGDTIVFNNGFRRIIVADLIPEVADASIATRQDILCLALNIYYEARGSSQDDRWAVGHVVMNRLGSNSFGPTICAVVWDVRYHGSKKHSYPVGQFSWTVIRHKSAKIPNDPSWEECQKIAYLLVNDTDMYDPTGGRMHYWNPKKANPRWGHRSSDPLQIGSHRYVNMVRND